MKKYTIALLSSLLFCTTFSYANQVSSDVKKHEAKHHIAKQQTGPVNINKADATELATLKGLGEKKAEAIVAYRQAHGDFKSLNDLTNIKGMGKKFVARLQKSNPDRMQLTQ